MTAPRITMPDGKPEPGTVFFVESIFCQIHKIPLAFVRALEHNASHGFAIGANRA